MLSKERYQTATGPLYLVALDLDKVQKCEADKAFARDVFKRLGSYMEISPSGEGLRFFVLSTHKPNSRQTAHGEIYAEKRFLTVTGYRARKAIIENTTVVEQIDGEWGGASELPPEIRTLT